MANAVQSEVVSVLALVRTGDPARREELGSHLASIRDAVRKYCHRRIGRNLGEAEREEIETSVADDIIIELLSDKNPRFEDAFWTIVHNKMRNAIRSARRLQKKRDARLDLDAFIGEDDPLHTEAEENRRMIVWETLASTPWKPRQAFVLHRLLGYEISSQDRSADSVRAPELFQANCEPVDPECREIPGT